MKLVQMCCVAIMLTTSLSVITTAQGGELFQEVIKNAKQCRTDKSRQEIISCYVEATPAKCESQVYDWFARRNPKAWFLCVESCADAGYWSRTFGGCARETFKKS